MCGEQEVDKCNLKTCIMLKNEQIKMEVIRGSMTKKLFMDQTIF